MFVLEILMRSASLISCIACLLVMIIYLTTTSIRNKSYNDIIFFISLSDFLASVGGLLGTAKSGSLKCSIQTLLTNIFPLSSIFWTTVIIYILYIIIIQQQKKLTTTTTTQNTLSTSIWWHYICWGIPTIVSLLPLTTETYGTHDGKDGWCYLRHKEKYPQWTYKFWVIISFCMWIYLALFLYIALLIYIFYHISSTSTGKSTNILIKKILKRLIWYPVIIIVSWSVITVYILWVAFHSSSSFLMNQTFIEITFSVPLFSGFLTSLAFFMSSKEAKNRLYQFALLIYDYFLYCWSTIPNDRTLILGGNSSDQDRQLSPLHQIEGTRQFEAEMKHSSSSRETTVLV